MLPVKTDTRLNVKNPLLFVNLRYIGGSNTNQYLAKQTNRDYYWALITTALNVFFYVRYLLTNTTIEELMKYKQCLAACGILMLSFSASSALAAADAKGSAKVQWQVEKSWQIPSKPLDIVYALDGKRVFILTDQDKVLVYTAEGDLLGKIDVEKGVTAIDIAPRGEKLYLINQKDNSFTDLIVDFVVNVNTQGSPYLGNANAPVTIAVFTDFE